MANPGSCKPATIRSKKIDQERGHPSSMASNKAKCTINKRAPARTTSEAELGLAGLGAGVRESGGW